MNVQGTPHRSIEWNRETDEVHIIDQTLLPHEFKRIPLNTLEDAAKAIKIMQVRGAPLIGITAAFGIALALRHKNNQQNLEYAAEYLITTRPTAVNLRWAVEQMLVTLEPLAESERVTQAFEKAQALADEDASICENIGIHGYECFKQAWQDKLEKTNGEAESLNILTHCNAGWLATVDWGTALAPMYKAHDAGIPLHIWVDETRPRNQGASITAWELGEHGISHTVIADNTGGHLMQHGKVDLCIVGTDRTSACGDVCNKIGTYLKALAADDNGVPFYVALPVSTIDWRLCNGKEIPIEERDAEEVSYISGLAEDGQVHKVLLSPPTSPAANYAFDVTPARLVTALITEHGIFAANKESLQPLAPKTV